MTPRDKAKTIVESHYASGEARWMRKNLDGVGYLTRAYSALHALALDSTKRRALIAAILHLEAFYGDKYDKELLARGAL